MNRLPASSPAPTADAAEGEIKMTRQAIIEMIERAGFEAVERDTVYNRVAPAFVFGPV